MIGYTCTFSRPSSGPPFKRATERLPKVHVLPKYQTLWYFASGQSPEATGELALNLRAQYEPASMGHTQLLAWGFDVAAAWRQQLHSPDAMKLSARGIARVIAVSARSSLFEQWEKARAPVCVRFEWINSSFVCLRNFHARNRPIKLRCPVISKCNVKTYYAHTRPYRKIAYVQ